MAEQDILHMRAVTPLEVAEVGHRVVVPEHQEVVAEQLCRLHLVVEHLRRRPACIAASVAQRQKARPPTKGSRPRTPQQSDRSKPRTFATRARARSCVDSTAVRRFAGVLSGGPREGPTAVVLVPADTVRVPRGICGDGSARGARPPHPPSRGEAPRLFPKAT